MSLDVAYANMTHTPSIGWASGSNLLPKLSGGEKFTEFTDASLLRIPCQLVEPHDTAHLLENGCLASIDAANQVGGRWIILDASFTSDQQLELIANISQLFVTVVSKLSFVESQSLSNFQSLPRWCASDAQGTRSLRRSQKPVLFVVDFVKAGEF